GIVIQTEILITATLFFVILLADADLGATNIPAVDADTSGHGERFTSWLDAPLRLSLQTTENLSCGAIGEWVPARSDADTQAYRLAKQVVNPVSWLLSVPFQANEDFGYGPSHNGYKFTLNVQPVIPISISKDWNLILRTIVPIVSQHDLFYVENVPRSLGITQNRSQDGLSDTTQSFFF